MSTGPTQRPPPTAPDPIAETRERIKHVRELRGLTQGELGKKVGGSQSLIAKIEGGDKARIESDLLARIADALDVSIEALHGREPLTLPASPPKEPERRSMSPAQARLPQGLEGFLEHHPDIARNKRLRWYLENQTFRTEPWVELDERFWARQADFWRDYLAELDEDGRAPSPRPPRKS